MKRHSACALLAILLLALLATSVRFFQIGEIPLRADERIILNEVEIK